MLNGGISLKNADEFFYDLEELRTPNEMKLYFEKKNQIINEDDEYIKLARLKKGLFKEFLEEFYPLYCFSQSKFCDKKAKVKIVLGNQGYDALLIQRDDSKIKIEITGYTDGKWENNDAKKLNDRGYGDVRFNDTKNLMARSENYLKKVIENVKNKSEINYTGISILICVDTFDYFEVYGNNSASFVDILKQEIFKIETSADHVFLLVLNNKDITQIDNNIYFIK
jgi:hypothetical protein